MAETIDTVIKKLRQRQNEDRQKSKEEFLNEKQESEQRSKKRREEEELKEAKYQELLRSRQPRKPTCSEKSYVIMLNLMTVSSEHQANFINNILTEIKIAKIKSEITVGLFGSQILFLRNPNDENLVAETEIVEMTETRTIDAMRETTRKYIMRGLKKPQTSFIFFTNSRTDESTCPGESIKVYADDFEFQYVLLSSTDLLNSNNIIWRKYDKDNPVGSLVDIILSIEHNRLKKVEKKWFFSLF